MSNLKIKRNRCIFDSIEEINVKYEVELVTPVNIPETSNFACYFIEDLYNVKFLQFYREDDLGLCYYNFNTEAWYLVNENLEKEIMEDFITIGPKYIYLRLTQQGDCDKTTFTLEHLLGVETDKGFINKINPNLRSFVDIGYMAHDPRDLQYYISDDSDETVSFDEYINRFYKTK